MDDQPVFKVVDRRPFNPDGSPRDLPPEAKEQPAPGSVQTPPDSVVDQRAETVAAAAGSNDPQAAASRRQPAPEDAVKGDPLDDPASFLSLIMSLASNAAASLGMMPHPVTGETGVDLKTAKHWIDVLGMLEKKTRGNLNPQEEHVFEGLLADLRMQFVSFSGAPTPPPARFSASDITGGK